MNLIVLQPGERGRVHRHREQEEVYLVLSGELTLLSRTASAVLGRDELARVGPEDAPPARQPRAGAGCTCWRSAARASTGPRRPGVGVVGRGRRGRTPQDVPLPPDEPA